MSSSRIETLINEVQATFDRRPADVEAGLDRGVLPILSTPPVPSAISTSGDLAAARTSPNTIPAQSVGTAVTCYFSHRHRKNLEEIAGEQSVYLPPA
jgi:hypothetical protein